MPESTFKKDILKIPASVEDGDHVHGVSFDPAENAVRSYDLLAEEPDSDGLKFRNDPPPFRQTLKALGAGFEFVEKLIGVAGVVSRDILDDGNDIVNRNGRPPDLVPLRHAGFVF